MLTRQKFVLSRLPEPILKKKGPAVNGVADVLKDEDGVACSFCKVNWWKASCILQGLTLQLMLATLDWPLVGFLVGQSGFETSFPATSTALSSFCGFFFLLSTLIYSFQHLKSFDFVFSFNKIFNWMTKRWKILWSERNQISL